MKEYTGWRNFKSVIRKETGLNSASEISEGSGVSKYALDTLFNNRDRDVSRKVRAKIDRWVKKVTNGKYKLSDFTIDTSRAAFQEAVGNITEEEVKEAQHKQALEDEQKNRFNHISPDAVNLFEIPTGDELASASGWDVPTLIRRENERKDKLEMDRHQEVDGWKEESLEEFFASLDRYRSGLGKLAKKEIDRIQMLVLSNFDLDGRPDGQHYARQLEYVYIMGIERGWQEAQEDHAEVLRNLLQETYKGAKDNG